MADKTKKDAVFGSVTVMVVEDDPGAMSLIERQLKTFGVGNVVTAENAIIALEKLGEEDLAVDLIISDIGMPEMDGYEFIRRIRYGMVPAIKDVPTLVLTGKDTERNVRRAQIHKISGFIVKPPTVETLEQHLRDALGF